MIDVLLAGFQFEFVKIFIMSFREWKCEIEMFLTVFRAHY